jgi:hypothetical protein
MAYFCSAAAVTILSLSAVAADAVPREIRELRCDTLEMERGRVVVVEGEGLRVLRDTALGGDFNPGFSRPVAGIMCARNTIVPAAHDDEVILLGMPLHITQTGSNGRLAVLEIDHGRYRFRVLGGRAPDAAEQAAIDARVAEFQARFPTRR